MESDMRLVDRLRGIRRGGQVERCHNVPHHGSYSNAAHSWGVAMIMWLLWPEHFPRLGIYCLTHDIPEGQTGDIPATTLRYNPEIRESLEPLERLISAGLGVPSEHDLTGVDRDMLKICDRLELYTWAVEQELWLSNLYAAPLRKELDYYLEKVGLPIRAAALLDQLRELPFVERSGIWMEKLTQETE